MTDALELFFNWQMDTNWSWGPLLYLRPPRNTRLTLGFWLKLLGFTLLFAAVSGAVLGAALLYYDYAAAKYHDTKIPPVVFSENLMNGTAPAAVLTYSALAIAIALADFFCQHWAWNRRADRLNREAALPSPAVVAFGIWPPPPTVSEGNVPKA